MKANQFRIVSVSVAVRIDDAADVAQQLSDVSSNFGIYSMGAIQRTPNRAEWNEIRENVPEDILGEETQRRDEKHGLYGGKVDDAN